MKSTYFHEESTVSTYQVAGQSFRIEISKDVFPPSEWALRVMEALRVKKNNRVIDIGTGTGVIGIYAALLGGDVFATDTSPAAILQTEKNATLNGVSIASSVGGFFADFEPSFDLIVANLPQEIVPASYPVKEELLATIKGGEKGNEILMDFLRLAPHYMHDYSRVIIPVCSLSFYLETFKYLSRFFEVRLIDVFNIKTKDFVPGFTEEFQQLNAAGHIKLFNRSGTWYYSLYIVELTKKKNGHFITLS